MISMISMTTVKNLLLSTSLVAAISFSAGVSGQTPGTTAPPVPAARPAASGVMAVGDMTEGEVRKVDKAAGKITVKHGEIRNLDMPAMTMVFQVRSLSALASLKAGDKVRLKVEKAGSALVVTDIQPVK